MGERDASVVIRNLRHRDVRRSYAHTLDQLNLSVVLILDIITFKW